MDNLAETYLCSNSFNWSNFHARHWLVRIIQHCVNAPVFYGHISTVHMHMYVRVQSQTTLNSNHCILTSNWFVTYLAHKNNTLSSASEEIVDVLPSGYSIKAGRCILANFWVCSNAIQLLNRQYMDALPPRLKQKNPSFSIATRWPNYSWNMHWRDFRKMGPVPELSSTNYPNSTIQYVTTVWLHLSDELREIQHNTHYTILRRAHTWWALECASGEGESDANQMRINLMHSHWFWNSQVTHIAHAKLAGGTVS